MIKVIQSGSVKSFTRKCQFCGCVFSYNEKDIKKSDDNGNKLDYIECPECYNAITLLYK